MIFLKELEKVTERTFSIRTLAGTMRDSYMGLVALRNRLSRGEFEKRKSRSNQKLIEIRSEEQKGPHAVSEQKKLLTVKTWVNSFHPSTCYQSQMVIF